MSTTRFVRSTRSKFFIYVCAILAFGFVVYLFHGSQQQLDDNRKALASCNQQTESLSAQLQVIFEQKKRLEESLLKEKTDHRQSRDDCMNRAREDKEEKERELVEADKKYSALLQSTNLHQIKIKDLEDENNELRKKNLKLIEEIEIQKKQLSAKLLEEQQLRSNKEKALEHVKNNNLELEVKLNKATNDIEECKKQLPESSRINHLEKVKFQLENELKAVKTKLESCLSGSNQIDKKVSVGGVGDNQSGVEPPKYMFVNKSGSNSTTPVINPEAVIEHDVSSPKPQSKVTKETSSLDTKNKPNQDAAAPIQNPLKQAENMNDAEINRQIPMPNNLEPHPQQSPENTVIKKPEYADADKKKDDLAEEDQGGELGHGVAGPLNPIQEPVAHPLQRPEGQNQLEAAKNKMQNAIQWEEEGQQNGAHEDAEDEGAAPKGWKNGEEVENRVLPRHMNHDYPGQDYNQEEEEDEEGEQMDYLGGDAAIKHPKQMAKFRQFDHNIGGGGGGGIMLNPK